MRVTFSSSDNPPYLGRRPWKESRPGMPRAGAETGAGGVLRGGETLAGPWRLRVDRSTRTSCSRSLPTFKRHGPGAIAKVRKYQPAAYLKVCAMLVPREMKLEHSGGVRRYIEREMKERQ